MSRIWCVNRRLEISAVVSAEEAGKGGKRWEKAGKGGKKHDFSCIYLGFVSNGDRKPFSWSFDSSGRIRVPFHKGLRASLQFVMSFMLVLVWLGW